MDYNESHPLKPFGVKISHTRHNPRALAHILGNEFTAERWFETDEERQIFLKQYQENFIYYREGDQPSFRYELLENPQNKEGLTVSI